MSSHNNNYMDFSYLPRIYANISIIQSKSFLLSGQTAFYLKKVLRLKIGDYFKIFNSINGEFIAEILHFQGNFVVFRAIMLYREIKNESPLQIGISIIKADKMISAINMSVQLGVTRIIPLVADRSQFCNINSFKISRCIVEYTEQSNRMILPVLEQPIKLRTLINNYVYNSIVYANEKENISNNIFKISHHIKSDTLLLIGPEGGFSREEIELLNAHPKCHSFSLGANILRTETAVAASLAQIKLITN